MQERKKAATSFSFINIILKKRLHFILKSCFLHAFPLMNAVISRFFFDESASVFFFNFFQLMIICFKEVICSINLSAGGEN